MKELGKIPTGKIQRAMKFATTGAKVGGNYVSHYSKKLVDPKRSRGELDEANAQEIYKSLSELKGSALKAAQMISMNPDWLPAAYRQKFSLSQYSAPPLSYPLVVKTFREEFGEEPLALFEEFSRAAVNAASIGQVHAARRDGRKLAVKVQYPGVGDSVMTDLKMVRPLAIRLLNVNGKELDHFMDEVAVKMLEETDYGLELTRSLEISAACRDLEGIDFPQYYPELSAKRVLTMDWLDGEHLREFLKRKPDQELLNLLGQRLWDCFHFQIHTLRKLHADPHPGNFLFREDGSIGILDFGCVKEIPEDFYSHYFSLVRQDLLEPGNLDARDDLFRAMGFIYDHDDAEQRRFFTQFFCEMIELLARPFHSDRFYFGDRTYFDEIYAFGERVRRDRDLRDNKTVRGRKDAIYIDRTYFGLYHILHDLNATINVTKPAWLQGAGAADPAVV